jgi:hypothetical protein
MCRWQVHPHGTRRVAELADALGCGTEQLARMVCRQPALLTLSAATLRGKFEALTGALGLELEVREGRVVRVFRV